jgi:hypothetical protein
LKHFSLMILLTCLVLDLKRHLSINDRRQILKPKKTKGTACPANLSDTSGCAAAVTAVANAASSWTNEGTVEAAIDAYLTACPASQCQAACVLVIPEGGRTVLPADDGTGSGTGTLASDFATACDQPTSVKTAATVCTGTLENAVDCNTTYNNVLTALGAATWVGTTIKTNVDLYTTSCAVTSCTEQCTPIVSNVELALPFNNFLVNFTTLCNPFPPSPSPPPAGGGGNGENNDLGLLNLKPNVALIFMLMVNVLATFIFSW